MQILSITSVHRDPLSHNPSIPVFVCMSYFITLPLWLSLHFCTLLYLPYFYIRMGSLLVWKCSSPKRPNSTQRPGRPLSMMSFSTRLPTMETLPLPAKLLPPTAPWVTPPLMPFLNHPNHLRHPSHPRFLSHQNHPNMARSTNPATTNPWLEGTPHLAVIHHLDATHHPVDTQHLGAILPPPAIHLLTTLPPNTNTCSPPPHLSYASLEVGLKLLAQRAQGLGESIRVNTFIHPPPHLILPSLPHRHPRWSTAQSAPGPCHHCRDQDCNQPYPAFVLSNAKTFVII